MISTNIFTNKKVHYSPSFSQAVGCVCLVGARWTCIFSRSHKEYNTEQTPTKNVFTVSHEPSYQHKTIF